MIWRRVALNARVMWAAAVRFSDHEGFVLAGYIAFSVLLSVFPFLIFATALTGFLVGQEQSAAVVRMLFDLAPENIAQGVAPVISDVLDRDRGGLLTISGLGAIWVASNGVEAFRTAFDRAHGVDRPRNVVVRRIIAVVFVFTGGLTFTVLSFGVVGLPLIMRGFERFAGVHVPYGLLGIRYALGIAVLVMFLWSMHRYLPSRPMRGRRIWPGIRVTIFLWMLGAAAFSTYLSYAPSYSVTYGAMAGVIVTLLFLYLTGVIIIFGAEINAAMLREEADVDAPPPSEHEPLTELEEAQESAESHVEREHGVGVGF